MNKKDKVYYFPFDTENDCKVVSVRIPRYQCIPGFHFTSLFFIANNFVDNHLKFLCQGLIDPKNMNRSFKNENDLKYFLENEKNLIAIDFSIFFSKMMKKLMTLMINVNEDKTENDHFMSKYYSAFYSSFYDRNPNVIDQIIKSIDYLGVANYTLINHDEQASNSTIEDVLRNNCLDRSILIYSRSGINTPIVLPLKILIGTKIDYDPLFTLFYVIGSQNGIPVLFFFSNESIIKIYDNQALKYDSYDEALKSGTIIYFISYSPRDLNYKFTWFSQNYGYNSSIHGQINTSTDSILENFLMGVSKMEDWGRTDVSFIDYLIQSIQYPAFFARGCGIDMEIVDRVGFIATICLGSDENAKDSAFDDMNIMDATRNTIQEYSYFTLFVRMLLLFLKSIDQENESDFDTYLRALFRTLPIKNRFITVCFYYFIVNLFERIPNNSALNEKKKYIEAFIEMTVDEPSKSLFEGKKRTAKKSSIGGNFVGTFNYPKLVPETITPFNAIVEINGIEKMENLNRIINITEFSDSFNLSNFESRTKFKVFSNYEKFLTQFYTNLAISL